MPSALETLQSLTKHLERLQQDYMLIGGYALPYYGLIRATIDIDIAIALHLPDPTQLKRELEHAGFQISSFSEQTPCFVITDMKSMTEIEAWIKPDGIVMDAECLRSRNRVSIKGFDFWIVGPEDLIVSKLARTDRRAQDEGDVLSILGNSRLKLDELYLHTIATRAGILPLLNGLQKKMNRQGIENRKSI